MLWLGPDPAGTGGGISAAALHNRRRLTSQVCQDPLLERQKNSQAGGHGAPGVPCEGEVAVSYHPPPGTRLLLGGLAQHWCGVVSSDVLQGLGLYLGNGAVWSENSFLLFSAQISASGEAVHWVGEAPRRCCSAAVRPRPLLAGAAVEPPHGHSSAWQPRHDPTSPAGCRGGPLARTSVGTVSPLRLLLTGRGFRPVPVTVSHHLRGSCGPGQALEPPAGPLPRRDLHGVTQPSGFDSSQPSAG